MEEAKTETTEPVEPPQAPAQPVHIINDPDTLRALSFVRRANQGRIR